MDKILVVEDDVKIAEHLKTQIEKYGYQASVVSDFSHVLDTFKQVKPLVVLLDINLPFYDGFYWCRQIRTVSTCPVIFISARTGEMDQIMALENGGDDYITKPFHPEVVMAKVRSQIRRAYGEYAAELTERILEVDRLKLYPERLELTFDDTRVKLTKNETAILEVLFTRYPKVAGREDILEKLWDGDGFIDENTLNVNLTRVRKKLAELGLENAILTVRGVGYLVEKTW